MNCLDSSFWIEYFMDGPRAGAVEPVLAEPSQIVVPSICLVEVGRYLALNDEPELARTKMSALERAQVIPLEASIASDAVRLGMEHKLAMADSIIYATARAMDATLWTLDGDFEGLPGVKCFSKKK